MLNSVKLHKTPIPVKEFTLKKVDKEFGIFDRQDNEVKDFPVPTGLCLIFGMPGSGKTTFLNLLANKSLAQGMLGISISFYGKEVINTPNTLVLDLKVLTETELKLDQLLNDDTSPQTLNTHVVFDLYNLIDKPLLLEMGIKLVTQYIDKFTQYYKDTPIFLHIDELAIVTREIGDDKSLYQLIFAGLSKDISVILALQDVRDLTQNNNSKEILLLCDNYFFFKHTVVSSSIGLFNSLSKEIESLRVTKESCEFIYFTPPTQDIYVDPENTLRLVDIKEKPEKGALILGIDSKTQKRIDLSSSFMRKHTIIVTSSQQENKENFIHPQLANFNGSIVHTEFEKGLVNSSWELATSEYHQNAWLYHFGNSKISHPFNWIPLCKDNPGLCYQLAQALILSTESANASSTFLTESATGLLSALFAHVSSLEDATAITAFDLFNSSNCGELITKLLNSHNPMAGKFIRAYAPLNGRVQQAIFSLIKQKLMFVENPQVRNILSGSVEAPDFRQLKKEKIAVSWVVPELEAHLIKPLTSLFFTMLLHQLQQSNGDIPICILLDEMANIGYIPNLDVRFTTLRSSNIGLVLGLKRLEQLRDIYGQQKAEVILNNSSSKLLLTNCSTALEDSLKTIPNLAIKPKSLKQILAKDNSQLVLLISDNPPILASRYSLNSSSF